MKTILQMVVEGKGRQGWKVGQLTCDKRPKLCGETNAQGEPFNMLHYMASLSFEFHRRDLTFLWGPGLSYSYASDVWGRIWVEDFGILSNGENVSIQLAIIQKKSQVEETL